MRHTRIAVVGAGMVGATTAYALIMRNVCSEILLVDVDQKHLQGEALDLNDSLSFSDTSAVKCASLADIHDVDIIIMTAGVAQLPGETRLDLLLRNKSVIDAIFDKIKPVSSNTIILMVTNPVDVMTQYVQYISGLPVSQVFGSGTFLDSQRLRNLLAQRLNIAEASIHAYVLGEHGDSQFAAWSLANISGIPLLSFPNIDEHYLRECGHEAQQKAYRIIENKKATYYGIGACVSVICEDVLYNTKRSIPVSVYLEAFDACCSVPVIVGRNGIMQILPLHLTDDENLRLKASADKVHTIFMENCRKI